ncbi:hypothetical protein, partial [Caballeronia sp. BR00000012568055]|uniref:hypothetical protein n=1 Tax=Caballeronia sp. BR00000012568055 TaxID=2918761 RepID=UPI0023F6A697
IQRPAAPASSAHTYRLLVFKEHTAKPNSLPFRLASLHQQQRNEIMKNLFIVVNSIFCFRFQIC